MYCLNMFHIAVALGQHDRVYEDMAAKFFEHFLFIAAAMTGASGTGLWDDTDNFYYDQLCMPDGSISPMRIRSMVGLIPLFAVAVVEGDRLERLPGLLERMRLFPRAAQRSGAARLALERARRRQTGTCCRWRASSA